MGNKDYLSGGCIMGWCADLPGKLCYEKLDKKKIKMIIWLCQKILIKIWSKRGPWPHPPPSLPPHPKKKNQIWILCQNSLTRELKIRVVGFVLKKLLTYFEMLIVPHALQCVDGCCFCILPHLTLCFWHTKFRFKFFGKIHLLESSI